MAISVSQWFFLNGSQWLSMITSVSPWFAVVLNGEQVVALCSSQFYRSLLLVTSGSQWLPCSGLHMVTSGSK